MPGREPNMEDPAYRVFKSEKELDRKIKKKPKTTYEQLDIFSGDNNGPV